MASQTSELGAPLAPEIGMPDIQSLPDTPPILPTIASLPDIPLSPLLSQAANGPTPPHENPDPRMATPPVDPTGEQASVGPNQPAPVSSSARRMTRQSSTALEKAVAQPLLPATTSEPTQETVNAPSVDASPTKRKGTIAELATKLEGFKSEVMTTNASVTGDIKDLQTKLARLANDISIMPGMAGSDETREKLANLIIAHNSLINKVGTIRSQNTTLADTVRSMETKMGAMENSVQEMLDMMKQNRTSSVLVPAEKRSRIEGDPNSTLTAAPVGPPPSSTPVFAISAPAVGMHQTSYATGFGGPGMQHFPSAPPIDHFAQGSSRVPDAPSVMHTHPTQYIPTVPPTLQNGYQHASSGQFPHHSPSVLLGPVRGWDSRAQNLRSQVIKLIKQLPFPNSFVWNTLQVSLTHDPNTIKITFGTSREATNFKQMWVRHRPTGYEVTTARYESEN